MSQQKVQRTWVQRLGVAESPSLTASFLTLAAWALIPAAIGLIMVRRHDVV